MKALTVKNPWAYLIIHYGKSIENRSVKTTYRGRIAIHASKTSDVGAYALDPADPVLKAAFQEMRARRADIEALNGRVIGTVELYNCTYPELTKAAKPDDPWAEPGAPWHYWLKDPVPLEEPVAARGMLGFWEWRE